LKATITYTQPQRDIFFSGLKKYNVILKGRRFGLTKGAAYFLIQRCYESEIACLWIETVNGNIDRYYERYFQPVLRKFPSSTWTWNTQKRELKIHGSVIDFRSSDNPENIEGFAYHYIFMNESGIILRDKYLFENAVKPMLMDFPDSKLIAGGVPKGRRHKGELHPFYQLWLDAQADPVNYKTWHYTSYDNPFLEKAEIDLMASTMDDSTRLQEIEGEFIDLAESPFFYAFKESTHVIDSYEPNIYMPILLMMDFNKNPMTSLIGQQTNINSFIIFDELKIPNGSTPEICDMVEVKYRSWLLHSIQVTGDATGASRSPLVRGGLNHYKIVKQRLGILDRNFLLRKKNLSHLNSRILCNSVFQNANVRITRNCKNLIADCIYAGVDAEGELVKTADQGLHFCDCIRYGIDAVFPDFVGKPERYELS
jgi:hypothetical protein